MSKFNKCWSCIVKIFNVVLFIANGILLGYNTHFLCNEYPRYFDKDNLGFDYLGAIVGILALLVTLLIGWNIYQLVDVKGIRKEFEAYKEDVKSDINKHLLLEEAALAMEYWKERDWGKVFTIRSNMAHRYMQLLENGSNTDISDFVSSVAQMIERDLKEIDYIQHGAQLSGFMAIFQQLSKYNRRINDIYNQYKENDSKYRKPAQMSGISNCCEKNLQAQFERD